MIQENLTQKIITSLPPQKFLQPIATDTGLIQREKLLNNKFDTLGKKIVIIEGRAGAGKSVIAQQLVASNGAVHGWMQITESDQDQMAFLTALLTLIIKTFPDFQSQKVLPAVVNNIIHPLEILDFGRTLMEELSLTTQHSQVSLVLDDLHLLTPSPESLALLSTLIEESPSWLQWILVSRENVATPCNLSTIENSEQKILHIKDTDLDFSQHEIYQLFQNRYQLAPTGDQVNSIFQKTHGWVMGTVLLAQQRGDTPNVTNVDFTDSSNSLFGEYFIKNIMCNLQPEEVEQFLQLMLLDEIDTSLAANILGRMPAATLIDKAVKNNSFARSLDDEKTLYSFHHLFSAEMRAYSEEQLSDKVIQNTLTLATHYYTEKNEAEAALSYAARCSQPSILEETINIFGLELIGANHIRTLSSYLATFEEDYLLAKPTLSLYSGICYQEVNPIKGGALLENACSGFIENKNIIGEIQARCCLIEFYILIEGVLQKTVEHILKIETLFPAVEDNLPISIKARILSILAEGYCYVIADMEKAKFYIDETLKICTTNHFFNTRGRVAVMMNCRFGFIADWQGFLNNIEDTSHLIHRPDVSHMEKLFLQLNQVNFLQMTGDFKNYTHQKNLLLQSEQKEVIQQSLLLPFLNIYDVDIALAKGQYDDALSIIEQSVNLAAFQKPHTSSQFLHYKAIIHALKGEVNLGTEACKKSLEQRNHAGGNAFVIFNHQCIGIAYLHLGQIEEAKVHFSKADKIMQELGVDFRWAITDAHLAYYWLKQDEPQKAIEPTEKCLRYMREKNQLHFFTSTPEVMEAILTFAVENDIEPFYAKLLLKRQLELGADNSHKPIPLLKASLFKQPDDSTENDIFYLTNLPRKQRQLLLSLFVRTNMQLSLTEVNLIVWADKEPANLRSSIDNLITSLRKSIAPIVGVKNTKHYVVVNKGEVVLRNWQVDGSDFLAYCKKGRAFAEKKKLWQAGNAFHPAFKLLPEEGLNSSTFQHAEEVEDFFMYELAVAAKTYLDVLLSNRQESEALHIARKTYRLFPYDTDFCRKCYDIFAKAKDTVGCQLVLKNYETEYREMGYSDKELEDALQQFWSCS